ncbi:hypothetical protein DSM104635_02245 [Terricaulis silvestris]|uniref:Uncharacterized protein n=2 Tax=Terricaulis silvestris TaxID=2686094 RepID=A0A6I6MPU6_9CAUL|nr:hypothetical protein DSM104635_02245 [Terricaulis silvestris]
MFLPLGVLFPARMKLHVLDFFGDSFMPIAFALLIAWAGLTLWVVRRSPDKPIWLFLFGAPGVLFAVTWAWFAASCVYLNACI